MTLNYSSRQIYTLTLQNKHQGTYSWFFGTKMWHTSALFSLDFWISPCNESHTTCINIDTKVKHCLLHLVHMYNVLFQLFIQVILSDIGVLSVICEVFQCKCDRSKLTVNISMPAKQGWKIPIYLFNLLIQCKRDGGFKKNTRYALIMTSRSFDIYSPTRL